MSDEQKLESEKILEQIDALKSGKSQETKDQGEVQSPSEKAPEPKTEIQAAPKGQAESQQETPTDKKEGKSEVDYSEWAKKKGIKDADTAFRSLREMEQRLSRANAELREAREAKVVPPPYQPQPQWSQPPQFQAPSYPPYPMDREQILEREAAKRGWDKEDFRKVLDLADEVSDMKLRRIQAQNDTRYAELERETRRNSELRELMQDPLFTDKTVQFEMHKVLEDNPKAFTHEPSPYIYAFNEAQKRIARKFLQDKGSQEDSDPKQALPTRPPMDGQRGSSSGIERASDNKILEKFASAKSAEEQRKVLESMGAVKDY